jgi:hypothetical protein
MTGPAPLQGTQLEHLDLEDIARLRPLDKDRAGERIQAVEIEAGQRRGG